jgi:glycosyltransferase involved in cell wall biosynthesis
LKTRILFIGFPETSHTTSWIELLSGASFDVRLFGLPSGVTPEIFEFSSYATVPIGQVDPARQITQVFPPISDRVQLAQLALTSAMAITAHSGGYLRRLAHKALSRVKIGMEKRSDFSLEAALARVVHEWQPDIIHTLGFDPSAYFYLRTRDDFNLHGIGRWVAQARGGPDLDLYRHLPERMAQIRAVFEACNHFICDNQQNYDFAFANGLDRAKTEAPGVGIVSGPGGLDVDGLRSRWIKPPSQRPRRIVWPKTYETISSKGLPVLEALILAWDRIQPCEIECLWLVQDELRIYFDKMLPDHIKAACHVYDRLPRERVLEILADARVMLAPSLTDGIPNTMMEAMALGAFPIISPLATTLPVVMDETNVLFARNLYPEEIAEALVRAMNDDDLIDAAAEANVERVTKLADRKKVRARVIEFYQAVGDLTRRNATGI